MPLPRRAVLATTAAFCVALPLRDARAQHVHRTNDIAQAALIENGLATETTCRGGTTQAAPHDPHRGGLPELTPLDSAPRTRLPFHLAASIGGLADGRDSASVVAWQGSGLAQLQMHGRDTGCYFDWRARTIASARGRAGADAVVVGHWPGALGGALHLFGEVGAAGNRSAVEELDTPQHAELGAAYTTFNVFRTLLPSVYALAALDVRVRVSAGAALAYGESRRLRSQDVVPDLSAVVVGKIEEMLHGGVLYSAHVVPRYVTGARLTEHTVVLMHGFRSDGSSGWLLARSPYVMARYTARRVGTFSRQRELALNAGLTLF